MFSYTQREKSPHERRYCLWQPVALLPPKDLERLLKDVPEVLLLAVVTAGLAACDDELASSSQGAGISDIRIFGKGFTSIVTPESPTFISSPGPSKSFELGILEGREFVFEVGTGPFHLLLSYYIFQQYKASLLSVWTEVVVRP